jgi:hypothetical protein
MTEREMHKRLESVESRILGASAPETDEGYIQGQRATLSIIDSLFCPMKEERPPWTDEEKRQMLEERDRMHGKIEEEEKRLRRFLRADELWNIVQESVRESAKSDTKAGGIRHGDSEEEQAGQAESRE